MTDLYKSILLPLNQISCHIHCSVQQFNICGLAAEQTSTPVATTICRHRDNTKPTWVVATTIVGQLLQRKHTDCDHYSLIPCSRIT